MTDSLREVILRKVRLPLVRPYRLSYRTFTEFEPMIVYVRSAAGREGWGEGHISPGSSSETREGGWRFCRDFADKIVGLPAGEAKAAIAQAADTRKVAATAMISAIEMMEGDHALHLRTPAALPLITPFHALGRREMDDEVESLLHQGFRTFKVKVGSEVKSDLARVGAMQEVVAGRATLRIDANRGYSEQDGCRFASSLNPAGIELFEQPCAAEDWQANARVAEVSTVPVMLDEPICSLEDIDRASHIDGVEFCKLKLKRFGGIVRLREALARVRACGMEPILGDGLSSEIGCWMEACAGIGLVAAAGEYNGFLKPSVRLFRNALRFEQGKLHLPADYHPDIDRDVLKAHELACERFEAG